MQQQGSPPGNGLIPNDTAVRADFLTVSERVTARFDVLGLSGLHRRFNRWTTEPEGPRETSWRRLILNESTNPV